MTYQTTHVLSAEAIGHHPHPTTSITLPEQWFQLSPVIHPTNFVGDPASRTFWSAEANARYIVRASGSDIFGQTPNWSAKRANLGEHGRRAPLGKNGVIPSGFELWRAADEAARHERGDAPVAWHMIGWLDQDRSEIDWRFKVTGFIDRYLIAQGMTADWAIHRQTDGQGRWITKPHVHIVATARFYAGPRIGQPQPNWLTSRKMRDALRDAW